MQRSSVVLIFMMAAAGSRAFADEPNTSLFTPASASSGFFVADSPAIAPRGTVHVGAALELGTRLLVIRDPETGAIAMDGEVVGERLAMHLVGGVGVHERLELGAAIATALQGGDASPYRPGLRTSALGDLRLRAKLALRRTGRVRLSGLVEASLPTASSDAWFGERTASVMPALIAGATAGPLELAAHAGYRLRGPSRFGDLVVDDEIVAGVAVRAPLIANRVWLQSELYGAYGVQGRGNVHERPLEVLAGLRVRVRGPWLAQAGLGTGLTHGYGTAETRGVLMIGFAPEPHAAEPRQRAAFVPPEDIALPPVAPPPEPAPEPAPEIRIVGDRIVLPASVLFDLAGSDVKPAGRAVLGDVLRLWRAHPEWDAMTIEGHTDVRGTAAANQQLSEQRAARVREALVGLGAAPGRVLATGFGESKPVARGATEADHAQNRRVEFVITRRRVP